METLDLHSLRIGQIEHLVANLQQPKYRAEHIFRWVHRLGATSTDDMTNLPTDLRARLAQTVTLVPLAIDAALDAADGTRKLRLRCSDGALIESVLIPRQEKLTLCVSSQVGCALGCRFCATATMGMRRNLTPGEIVDQVYRNRSLLSPGRRITHLVFMGMGEPLANLDAVEVAVENLCSQAGADFSMRRITISTAGLVPGLRELGRRMPSVGLAISLHATTDEVRSRLMPINRRWPLAQLLGALRNYPLARRRRITFEYILLPGINDTDADIKRFPRLLQGIPAKINLLPYNPCRADQPQLTRPSFDALERFADALRAKGLTATVRHSRGLDISAACGQLVVGGHATNSDGD